MVRFYGLVYHFIRVFPDLGEADPQDRPGFISNFVIFCPVACPPGQYDGDVIADTQFHGIAKKTVGFLPQLCLAFPGHPMPGFDAGHGQQYNTIQFVRQSLFKFPGIPDVAQNAMGPEFFYFFDLAFRPRQGMHLVFAGDQSWQQMTAHQSRSADEQYSHSRCSFAWKTVSPGLIWFFPLFCRTLVSKAEALAR
jgi:hypothetical protein